VVPAVTGALNAGELDKVGASYVNAASIVAAAELASNPILIPVERPAGAAQRTLVDVCQEDVVQNKAPIDTDDE